MKILVVDDEMVSRKKMQKIMQNFGECQTADSGKAAVEAYTEAILARQPFRLITLDVSMPDMGGTDVLALIRTHERNNAIAQKERVKILMVTSHADQETVITSITGGCDDYIKKPFSMERVAQTLKKVGLAQSSESLPFQQSDEQI